jgi:hypothetical protein
LAGQVADGWVPSFRGDLKKIAEMTEQLDVAATKAGRDPASIRRILNVKGVITDGATNGRLHGPVNHWVEELTGLATAFRFDTFIFWGEGLEQLQRFAEEIVPAVRAQVTIERA